MTKEYYCEDHDVWVSEALVLVEVDYFTKKPTYIQFDFPDEPCQLYYETEMR